MQIEGTSALQRAQAAYARQTPREPGAALALLAMRRSEVAVKLGPLSVRYETESPTDPNTAAREVARLLGSVQAPDAEHPRRRAALAALSGGMEAAGLASASSPGSIAGIAPGEASALMPAAMQHAGAVNAAGMAQGRPGDATPSPACSPAVAARAYARAARFESSPVMFSCRV